MPEADRPQRHVRGVERGGDARHEPGGLLLLRGEGHADQGGRDCCHHIGGLHAQVSVLVHG